MFQVGQVLKKGEFESEFKKSSEEDDSSEDDSDSDDGRKKRILENMKNHVLNT